MDAILVSLPSNLGNKLYMHSSNNAIFMQVCDGYNLSD
jgi:hypothetical protein